MRFAKQLSAATALLAITADAFAHGGHGMEGAHWHATDVSGFVLVVVLAALAIFFSRGE
jgi:hypothetical protein